MWGANGSTIYYTTLDEEHRPNKVWRHIMGLPQSSDELLLMEDDELFWIDLDKSCSGRFLIVRTSSPDTSEVHLLDLTAAGAEKAGLKLVNKRVKDHRYLQHAHFCILSLCMLQLIASGCGWSGEGDVEALVATSVSRWGQQVLWGFKIFAGCAL